MPNLSSSSYQAPFWLRGGHAQTIFPSLFRRVPRPEPARVRVATQDEDFFHLDILRAAPGPAKGAVILSHGLEGDSGRGYMRGMALAFMEQGWDAVCRNFRCCGGEANAARGMYHSGQTDDLHAAVRHCLFAGYGRILLVGFSMGGNQVLKYLGEDPDAVPSEVLGAAVFSVPCDLAGCARALDRPGNAVYMRYFLRSLRVKVRQKHAQYPELYPLEGLSAIRTFAEFDERYTAPVHGFSSALDYWTRASCLPVLISVRKPALVVNAANDPFLAPTCYPRHIAENNPYLHLEVPREGGHVGFAARAGNGKYWSEARALGFFRDHGLLD